MNWDKAFEAYAAWREQFDAWKVQQLEYSRVVDCVQYHKEHGTMQGWPEQASKNMEIIERLQKRFHEDVEECPNINLVVM